ncbi:1-deoxy-D-xylulose-5-phosphate synthase [compost metagenome]
MVDHNYRSKVVRLGIPDKYVHHGTPEQLHADCGFDAFSIAAKVRELLNLSSSEGQVAQSEVG